MKFKQLLKRFSYSLLVATFVSNITIGGALTAYADPVQEQTVQTEEPKSNDSAILTGLLAIGLLTMLSSGGDDKQPPQSVSTKTSTPTSAKSTSQTSPITQTVPAGVSADERLAVELMNQDRVANGLKPLALNATITRIARAHGQDMINRNYFAHSNPDGQSSFDRLKAGGVSYRTAGENLAINRSVDAAEKAFMNSPGHRANILNADYTEVGIGVSYAPDGSVYVVQNFIGK